MRSLPLPPCELKLCDNLLGLYRLSSLSIMLLILELFDIGLAEPLFVAVEAALCAVDWLWYSLRSLINEKAENGLELLVASLEDVDVWVPPPLFEEATVEERHCGLISRAVALIPLSRSTRRGLSEYSPTFELVVLLLRSGFGVAVEAAPMDELFSACLNWIR